ncbi:MAG: cohesin domain-containing protein, partial [Nitrososphaerota archaeon]
MKSAFKSLYGFAAVAMLLLAAMPAIFAWLPPDDVAMWIEPHDGVNLTTANPLHTIGYKFNVTVWGKSNVEASGWQFNMRYDLLLLRPTGVWYCKADGTGSTSPPSEFMSGAGSLMSITPVLYDDGVYGYVLFGESWAGGAYAPEKPSGAKMALVEFEVIAVPGKGQTLQSSISISWTSEDTYILDYTGGGYYRTAYDAPYTFAWTTPPSPTLEVSPTTRFYDRYEVRNGTTFDETVRLTGLAAAWFLTNVSFTLTYNPNELEITNIVGNNVAWDVALDIDATTLGQVVVYAETSQQLSGDVNILTVTFKILDQEEFPVVENHVLGLTDVSAFDHTLEIPVTKAPATITVEGYLAVAMPWMEVQPKDTILGPEFVKHTTFQVNVTVNRLHFAWKLVGIQFRLSYDNSILKVVKVEEGPYLKQWAPHGTFPMIFIEPDTYGSHVLFGDIILPDGNGHWEPPFPGDNEGGPNENGTIAIITFEVLEQLPGYGSGAQDLTCALNLFDLLMCDPATQIIPIDLNRVVNGTVTIKGFAYQGRFIDVYGGANNAGYGSIPFPAPYGGQGLNKPMDLVIPQSEVTLFADVMYNYWPVQSKDVGFEVEGPFDHVNGQYIPRNNKFVLLKETARTDENGVATISFAMPWYCEDPESLLGVWKVTATVNIRDVVVMDTLYFYYDYMVHIWKVTTDKFYYAHCETVEITVEYGSHAMQEYPGLFSAIIKDELNVVIGMDLAEVTLGGAQFCTFANGTVTLSIHIEKWAFVGYADIYVNCYDKDPTEGGF